jgi:VPS62-like protein
LSDGGKWGTGISGASESGLKVVSARLGCGKTTTCTAWRNEELFGLDQEVSVTIVTLPGPGNAVRVYTRLQKPGADDGYMLRFQQTSGTDQLFIERIDGGATIVLATLAQEFLAGNKMMIRAIGPEIEAWRYDGAAWSEVGSATDSTYAGVGYVGVGLRGTSGRLDDFSAATLLGPTPDTSPVLDDFNRSDENPLSDGGEWDNSVYASSEQGLRVVSNELAAASLTDTAWRNDQYGPDQEAWVTIAVKPGGGNAVRVYARLQAPGTSGYDGYMLRYQQNAGIDQVFVERIDNSAIVTLKALNQEFCMNEKLKIRAVGSNIQAWRYDGRSWQMFGIVSDATYVGPGYIGLGLRNSSGRLDDFGGGGVSEPQPPPDPSPLLVRYVPELRFDMQEVYRADSAATITDNYQADYSNQLLDAAGTLLAASDPASSAETLDLAYLRPRYSSGALALSSDYVDEWNETRDLDAQRMHANPAYANAIYGREIPVAGGRLLQYWFFYYNNPKTFATVGDHEGDWEMIQVRVDAGGSPVGAVYAQHETGEYCPWDRVETTETGRPVVYVAHESHASYFWPGDHRIVVNNLPDQWDYADGQGESVVPSVTDTSTAPSWMEWPGKWGGADSSPRSPLHQDKWSNAQGFETAASSCTEMPSAPGSTTAPERPRVPEIEADRVGDNIVVKFRFEQSAGAPEPWLLVTTVDGPADGYTPTSKRTLVRSLSGQITQPVGEAQGPLSVLASVRAQNGARSRLVVTSVTG